MVRSESSAYKLWPVASLIAGMLEKAFGIPAVFRLDAPLEELPLSPEKRIFKNTWPLIAEAYASITDQRWALEERLEQCRGQLPTGPAQADIYFEHPYSMIVEFDEKQHFSQFRLKTLLLERVYPALVNLDWPAYLNHCRQRFIQPGISGFQKIKTYDPLFPDIYPGQKQNNRPRQRALRDLMKDLLPMEMPLNPTLRISYLESGAVIRNFGQSEIDAIEQSLILRGFPESLKII